jgi:hypothetical protein
MLQWVALASVHEVTAPHFYSEPNMRINIRVPEQLHEAVAKMAEQDHGVNGQIALMWKKQVLDKIKNPPRQPRSNTQARRLYRVPP